MVQSADYERIKQKIGEVCEENADFLNKIPIDIFGLARKMGFRLIKASDRLKIGIKKVKEFNEINKTKDVYGYTFFDQSKMEYVIYYDDVNAGRNKQRFSVAHEIGHIVLGHIDEGNENSLESECEANYFAGYFLCPDCLSANEEIYRILSEKTYSISTWFGIADDTAMIKYEHHSNRNSLPNNRYYEYERIIMECLEEAVLTKIRD
ncbi:MAG: ImmA/IrrE family metallo-endopeptidase [Bacilli bacterium]|nr:ImmA/IrrE family metallo-endopeptidase [Bacilli bacterium]